MNNFFHLAVVLVITTTSFSFLCQAQGITTGMTVEPAASDCSYTWRGKGCKTSGNDIQDLGPIKSTKFDDIKCICLEKAGENSDFGLLQIGASTWQCRLGDSLVAPGESCPRDKVVQLYSIRETEGSVYIGEPNEDEWKLWMK